MACIALDGVSKVYSPGVAAVCNLNLTIEAGELLALVGPSGSGKTTVLRLIAGLERPTQGSIRLHDQLVTSWSPSERNLAFVAEHGVLFPQHSVRENLAWSLRARGKRRWWWGGAQERVTRVAEAELGQRVERWAERLGLTELLERRPDQLSAGQQQRVALGRALVVEPPLLLLDEPLARLDGRLRVRLAQELKPWLRETRSTTVYVTHDRREAMRIADRIAVLHEGTLRQVGTPSDVYQRPADRVVAEWGGDGWIGWVRGNWTIRDNRTWFTAAGDDGQSWNVGESRRPLEGSHEVVLGLRPEAVRLTPSTADPRAATANLGGWGDEPAGDIGATQREQDSAAIVRGIVRWVEDQGSQRYGWVEWMGARRRRTGAKAAARGEDDGLLIGCLSRSCPGGPGLPVEARWRWKDALWFEAESGRHLSL